MALFANSSQVELRLDKSLVDCLLALGHALALVVHGGQGKLRVGISLIGSAFPITKHLVHRAVLGGRRPAP